MEHSYTRDWQPNDNIEVMATRTILIDRPPQCPSCHLSPNDDKLDAAEAYNPPIPAYNEDAGRTAMDETERSVRTSVNKNNRSDDEDWEARISKLGWTEQHHNLFRRVERLLDLDHMARMASKDSINECLRRRAIVEKSVSRMRQALASVQWNTRLTQWLHGLLANNLPPSYTVSYIEILQSLKRKQPQLVEKMMHERSIDLVNNNNKRPWEPTLVPKERKLPGEAVIVIVPSSPVVPTTPTTRMQRWLQLLGSLATVVTVQPNLSATTLEKQTFEQITEQLVALSRAKIVELRAEIPNRQIVLVGFNAGAALAVQTALVETVSSVVCLGFAYNTINGVRGTPDDRVLQITTPILFVLGQIAQRSSQEEIESLREKMQAQTSLVVVGNADDSLHVNKMNRQREGVTQSMIDNMITDEIQDFAATCIINPPSPRQPKLNNVAQEGHIGGRAVHLNSNSAPPPIAKRSKLNETDPNKPKIANKGRPRLNRTLPTPKKPRNPKRLLNQSNEAIQMAIDSILPTHQSPASVINDGIPPLLPIVGGTVTDGAAEIISTFELVGGAGGSTQLQPLAATTATKSLPPMAKSQLAAPPGNLTQKVKFVPNNQFVKLQPPPLNTQKIYMKTPKATVGSTQQQSITFRVAPSGDGKLPVGNKLITVKGKNVGLSTQILTTTNMVQQQRLTGATAAATVTASAATITSTSTSRPATPKFAIIKQTTGGQQMQSSPIQIQTQPQMQMQLQSQMAVKHQTTATAAPMITSPSISANDAELLNTSILDIPILFADKDGNINENAPAVSSETKETVVLATPTATTAGNFILIASQPNVNHTTMIQSRPMVVNSLTPSNALATAQGKFVVINRSNLKPATTNVMGARAMAPIKYTKMVVPGVADTGQATVTATVTSTVTSTMAMGKAMVNSASGATLTPGQKIDISALMKSGTVTQRAATVTSSTATTTAKPIIINNDKSSTTFKNIIKIPSSDATALKATATPTNSIVLKQGNLRTMNAVSGTVASMPVIKSGILNRNITVRKINIIRQPPIGHTMATLPVATAPQVSVTKTSAATTAAATVKDNQQHT